MPAWLDSVEETAPVQASAPVQAQQYDFPEFEMRALAEFYAFDVTFVHAGPSVPEPEPEPEPEYVSSVAAADAFVLTVETELYATMHKSLYTKVGTTISPTCHYSPHY
jgi:hypothetical protein